MKHIKLLFVLVCLVQSAHLKARKLPDYIKLCRRNDPNISACLKENAEILRPYLADGIPELKVPRLNPLNIPAIVISLNNFSANFTNINITGVVDYVVNDLSIDIDNNKMNVDVFLPNLHLEANYEVEGKILILELRGGGFSIGDITVEAKVEANGVRETRKGKIYLNFNERKLDFNVTKAKLVYENLFPNNKQLTDATNKIINDNVQEFLGELKPLLEEVIGAFAFNIIQSVFRQFSLEELFPA